LAATPNYRHKRYETGCLIMRSGLTITYVEKTGNVDFHLPGKNGKKGN